MAPTVDANTASPAMARLLVSPAWESTVSENVTIVPVSVTLVLMVAGPLYVWKPAVVTSPSKAITSVPAPVVIIKLVFA